jgi:hypothetical protein
MLRCPHVKCIVAIGFVPADGRSNRHVHIVITCPESSTVLVLLDAGDID